MGKGGDTPRRERRGRYHLFVEADYAILRRRFERGSIGR